MLKMSTIGRNAHVQTFAKVVDSFVDVVCGKSSHICCSVYFSALGWSLALIEVCKTLEASHLTHASRVWWVWWWSLVVCDEVGAIFYPFTEIN